MKEIKLFGKVIPIYSFEESFSKPKALITDSDPMFTLTACTTESMAPDQINFFTGMFGPGTIRLRAMYSGCKTELDLPGDDISKYPEGNIENQLLSLIKEIMSEKDQFKRPTTWSREQQLVESENEIENLRAQISDLERNTHSDGKHIKSLEEQLATYEKIINIFIESPQNKLMGDVRKLKEEIAGYRQDFINIIEMLGPVDLDKPEEAENILDEVSTIAEEALLIPRSHE